MDEEFVRKLLKSREEADWFDFKRKTRLYGTNREFNKQERDEFIKDILGLANGNSSIVRKTKYLIIGADDEKFDAEGMRVLFNVDYRVPSSSDITKWVNAASAPSVVGITCHLVSINGNNVYVVKIPPTFELHETIRELNAKGKFSKYTVFMRQDEHTVPASVKDGVTIQELKYLHRQEISNPFTIQFGAILGAATALLFWDAGYNATEITNQITEIVGKLVVLIVGGVCGAEAGWAFREWNSLRYDWRYYSLRKKN
ncbi:MAG: putative DNA binding domain-containing protein [Anaerolineae bacterium]|nr:putative DNA binding domain-containing protein [Anaerolineae bacterium]